MGQLNPLLEVARAAATTNDSPSACVRDAIVECRPVLLRQARQLCRDPELAEDLVQDVMLRALEKADQFAGRGCIEGWLSVILRNSFRMYLRRRREFTGYEGANGDSDQIEDEALANVSRSQLHDRLREQLRRADNELVRMYYGKQFTIHRIATELNTTPAAVKCRLYRLRKRVQVLAQGWQE